MFFLPDGWIDKYRYRYRYVNTTPALYKVIFKKFFSILGKFIGHIFTDVKGKSIFGKSHGLVENTLNLAHIAALPPHVS